MPEAEDQQNHPLQTRHQVKLQGRKKRKKNNVEKTHEKPAQEEAQHQFFHVLS